MLRQCPYIKLQTKLIAMLWAFLILKWYWNHNTKHQVCLQSGIFHKLEKNCIILSMAMPPYLSSVFLRKSYFVKHLLFSTMLSKTALALRYFTPKISTAVSVVMNNEAFSQYIFIDLLHIIWRLICSIWHFIGTIWHFFVNIRHFPGDLTTLLQSLRLTVIKNTCTRASFLIINIYKFIVACRFFVNN